MNTDNYIGFVYMWTNKINNKKYIGSRVGRVDDGYIGSGTHFKKAVKKYGIDNFERCILYYEYESKDNLWQKEFDVINEMNAVYSSQFYNMTNFAGRCVDGHKHHITTEETKQKIRDSHLGKTLTGKTKQKMSATRTGKKFSKSHRENISKAHKGKKLKTETKEKIRKSHTGLKHSKESKEKMSASRKGKPSPTKGMKGLTSGEKNGNYGKCWYRDPNTNKHGLYEKGNQPNGWEPGMHKPDTSKEKNPFYGKKHSNESIEKIKKGLKSVNRKGENNPAAKPVEVSGIKFKTIKDAMSHFNASYSTIIKECKYI